MKIFNKILAFYSCQKPRPFEAMLGFICIYSGLAGIFNFGIVNNAFNELLNHDLLLVLNSIYLISGLAMFFGLGFNKANIEALGIILLATTLIVRIIISIWLLGISPIVINGYVFNFAFIFACIVRLITIVDNNKVLIKNGTNAKLLV